MVTIVILTFNNVNYTKQCIESIFRCSNYPDYELIIVDNNSSDGTVEYLKSIQAEHPNIYLILNQENRGFAAGNNQGIQAAKGDYIILLNNDTIVSDGWIYGLIKYLKSDMRIGMVGPISNRVYNEAMVMFNCSDIEDIFSEAKYYTELNKDRSFETDMLGFFCVAIRKNIIDEVGLLDEQFEIGGFEDDDYCLRVKEKGYKLVCAEDVFIYHAGSVTFEPLPVETRRKIWEKNKAYFESKWGKKWVTPYRADIFLKKLEELFSHFITKEVGRENAEIKVKSIIGNLRQVYKEIDILREYVDKCDKHREALIEERQGLTKERDLLIAEREKIRNTFLIGRLVKKIVQNGG